MYSLRGCFTGFAEISHRNGEVLVVNRFIYSHIYRHNTCGKEVSILVLDAQSQRDNVVTFLRDIIRIPSTSTKEKEVVLRIKEEMEKVGFDEVIIDKIGSVAGRIGHGPVKILYDSHIDTVGVGDRASWDYDPFEGKFEKGIVYGRGASDNKAAIATMVYAGKLIKEKGLEDKITLWVLGSVQEEDCDGLSIKYFVENVFKPDFVVLGECTNLDIYRGHRGRMELSISTSGKSCHASAPDRGENAIYKMANFIKGIEELNERLKHDDFLGKGTIAVTMVECKTGSLNTVPDSCTIYLDRRLTVGETKETTVSELKEIVGDNATIDVLQYNTPSHTGLVIDIEKYYPTWVLEENHVLVQAGAEAARQIRGSEPLIDKWVFSTNGITTMGRMGIPTIGFGPSEERFAHSTDDQVTVEHLVKAMEFYTLFPEILAQRVN